MQQTFFTRFLLALILLLPLVKNATANHLIIATDDGPPHMIKATGGGIDIDIARQVLNEIGYETEITYVPLARAKVMVSERKADVFLPTFYQPDDKGIYLSDSIISYKPTVFSLASNNILYGSIKDLENLSVVTFQGASGYFGEEFSQLSEKVNYRELHNMETLPKLLLTKRYDVVVLDLYIFYYFLKKHLEGGETLGTYKEITSFPLVPEVKAHAGFNDKALRDKFNQQLSLFKKAKKDKKIVEHYIGIINPLENMEQH